MKFPRITVNPEQMAGVPCIRGLQIPVATVVAMVADAMSETEILGNYPDLEPGDIREALKLPAEALRKRELPCLRLEIPRRLNGEAVFVVRDSELGPDQ